MAVTALDCEPDEKSREVRIGLVMYGGVSLAIYINGVAHEFFRAVRGQGVYRLIKALTDSDVVVDIMSGTSAGGINGIMLAYALCNKLDFAASSALWREHGDIAKLLRSPKNRAPTSLLESEAFYQPKLEEVFRLMPDYDAKEEEDNSRFSELDLFVTATDVDGTIWTQFDDAGHAIDVKNHRSVFILSHRAGRKEPFAVHTTGRGDEAKAIVIEALAKLSRATSCFPAAFAPVYVGLGNPNASTADALLQEWGKLGKEASFLDGGVLDNKPFTYTLKSIFGRTANREVDRKLFYVEPDPEVMHASKEASRPTFLQAILAALIGIPGYESIADDLSLLSSRNSKLQQYKRLVADFGATAEKPSVEVQKLYSRSRMIALSERILRGIFRNQGRDGIIDPKDREQAARLVRDFDERIKGENVFDLFDVSYRIRRVARIVYLIYDLLYSSRESVPNEEERKRLLQLWRAVNRLFKVYEIVRSAMERFVDDISIAWKDLKDPQEVWRRVRVGLLRLIDEAAGPEPLLPPKQLQPDRFKDNDWLCQDVLTGLNARLKARSDSIAAEIDAGTFNFTAPGNPSTLLMTLDRLEEELIEHFTTAAHPILEAWKNFADLDAHLFPLEMVGDLHEKDVIETIRISPRDATRGFSQKGLSDKVAGDAVYHFGGFFKRSWRSNDILWGRIDGTCQIVETLLSRERIAKIVNTDGWRARLQQRFFEKPEAGTERVFRSALEPSRLFPKAGSRTQQDLSKWLGRLLSESKEDRDGALETATFERHLNLIVEAAQLEILYEDFPKVLTDAISEQAEWNAFKVLDEPTPQQLEEETKKSLRQSPFTFQGGKGPLDPFFTTVAAAERTRMAMEVFEEGKDVAGGSAVRPTETRLGKFFREGYNVGGEELTRDMPTGVLLEIFAHALLVFRNCVLNLFQPEFQRRIRRNPIYIFGIGLPLDAFYSAAMLSRRAPAWKLMIGISVLLICVVTLVIAAFWRDPLLWSGVGYHWGTILTLVVLPIAVFLLGMFLLTRLARGRNGNPESSQDTSER
jgi:predicted acylesterase/phospholipase RssA